MPINGNDCSESLYISCGYYFSCHESEHKITHIQWLMRVLLSCNCWGPFAPSHVRFHPNYFGRSNGCCRARRMRMNKITTHNEPSPPARLGWLPQKASAWCEHLTISKQEQVRKAIKMISLNFGWSTWPATRWKANKMPELDLIDTHMHIGHT